MLMNLPTNFNLPAYSPQFGGGGGSGGGSVYYGDTNVELQRGRRAQAGSDRTDCSEGRLRGDQQGKNHLGMINETILRHKGVPIGARPLRLLRKRPSFAHAVGRTVLKVSGRNSYLMAVLTFNSHVLICTAGLAKTTSGYRAVVAPGLA